MVRDFNEAEVKKIYSFKKYGKNTNSKLYTDICTIFGVEDTSFGRNIKGLLEWNVKFENDFEILLNMAEIALNKAEAKDVIKEIRVEITNISEAYSKLNTAKREKNQESCKYFSSDDRESIDKAKGKIEVMNEAIRLHEKKIREAKLEYKAQVREEYSYLF